MEKILVTTDFSDNSKAGMRFSIRLAMQYKFQLTFFHVYNITPPMETEGKVVLAFLF